MEWDECLVSFKHCRLDMYSVIWKIFFEKKKKMFLWPLSFDTLVKPFSELECSNDILGQSTKCCFREDFYLLALCLLKNILRKCDVWTCSEVYIRHRELCTCYLFFIMVLSLEMSLAAFFLSAVYCLVIIMSPKIQTQGVNSNSSFNSLSKENLMPSKTFSSSGI